MTQEFRITVAIPTYNRARLLRQTLAGVTRQDFPADRYEVIVIDNNSRDDTRDAVAAFAAARPAPRYVLEIRPGANHARNRGIAESTGKIVIFADDDILVEPDWLRQLVAPFAADATGKIGAVGGEVISVFPEGCPAWIRDFHGPQALRADLGPTRADQVPMSANLAFRRDILLQLGMFDTSVTRQGRRAFSSDENVLIRRLWRAGYEVWFAPAARVLHQMPASRLTFRYVARHAFDSARSRVADRVNDLRAYHRPTAGFLGSRLLANLLKAPGFAGWALLCLLLLRTGNAKQALVRAWRSCGYLYQISRSALGKM